jgi:probable rRNA maturation factor
MRVPRKRIVGLVEFVARAEGANFAELEIVVASSRQIAAINRKYLAHAGATDVITFDMSERVLPGIRSLVVVCGDIARKQAALRHTGVQRELLLYITHGLLHLLRYDDTTEEQAQKMHARQEKLLSQFYES